MSNCNEHQNINTDNDDDDDDDILDEIEEAMAAEMDKDEMDILAATMTNTLVSNSAGTSHATTHATLPPHQMNHAAEFWFPECRNCMCCKGYKHGCACGGLCKCSTKGTSGERKLSGAANTFVPTSYQGAVPVKAACKFYLLGNCRFGDSCLFSHDN